MGVIPLRPPKLSTLSADQLSKKIKTIFGCFTFKIEVLDLIDKHLLCPLTQILIQIEASFASTFFPLMKPIRPDLTEIYEAQQYFLTKYTNKFKIKRFLSESPVLKKLKEPINTEELDERDNQIKDLNNIQWASFFLLITGSIVFLSKFAKEKYGGMVNFGQIKLLFFFLQYEKCYLGFS